MENKHTDLVEKTCALIEAYDEGTPTLDYLGAALGMSPTHLQRVFKKITGISPRQYAETRRLETFKVHLKAGQSVTNSMYDAGFGGSSRLYETSNGKLGMTPASYGKGGIGAEITYAIGKCQLGRVMVAATAQGLCRVCFGDTVKTVEQELTDEFPEAALRRNEKDMAEILATVIAVIDNHAQKVGALPIDIRATAFQAKVWSYLTRIPAGETQTYGEIAAGIGVPKAARAVGRACGSNPIGVIIPCHRAVGASGSLTGYRWGIDRKKALLEIEGSI
jgi:AraC family transcriptional regulator, regulatory protein of adaptative response / methylated-DNA-[protein]-cysteine methyltransferase